MTLVPYFGVFPDKQKTELRNACFSNDPPHDSLTGATFLFTEYFCTDLECDCQRVLVKVLRAESPDDVPEEVAALSYSWNPDSDEIWSRLNGDMPNPFLDPFHQQAEYASELLEFWLAMYKRDRAYALRIQQHYQEIRAEVGQPGDKWRQNSRGRAAPTASTSKRRSLTKRERKARRARLAARNRR